MYAYLAMVLTIPFLFQWAYKNIEEQYKKYIYTNKVAANIISMILGTLSILLWAYAFEKSQAHWFEVLVHMVLLWSMLVVTSTDLHSYVIPSKISYPTVLICFSLAVIWYLFFAKGGKFLHYVLPPIVVLVLFIVLNKLGENVGHQIGGGDIVMFVAIACVQGWIVFFILIWFTILSLPYALIHMYFKRKTFPIMPVILVSYVTFVFLQYTTFLDRPS